MKIRSSTSKLGLQCTVVFQENDWMNVPLYIYFLKEQQRIYDAKNKVHIFLKYL